MMAVIGAGAAACGNGGAQPTPVPTTAATATPPGGYPGEVRLTDADNGAAVKLALGGTLTITLESNPSTGFSWYLAGLAGPELEMAGEPQYVPPASTTPLVGAAGTQVFTFRTTGIGMPPAGTPAIVQVALDYKRGFEPDAAPEKTFRITVEIQ
jgi:inhibitor of cysteine peptidase